MKAIEITDLNENEMELDIHPFNPKRKHLNAEEKEMIRTRKYVKRITVGINAMLIITIIILLISIACLGKSYAILFA